MPRTFSWRKVYRPAVFTAASDKGDAGFANGIINAVKWQLEQLNVETKDVAVQLKAAWADVRKNPGDEVLEKEVHAHERRLASLDERRKALEAAVAAKLSGGATSAVSSAGAMALAERAMAAVGAMQARQAAGGAQPLGLTTASKAGEFLASSTNPTNIDLVLSGVNVPQLEPQMIAKAVAHAEAQYQAAQMLTGKEPPVQALYMTITDALCKLGQKQPGRGSGSWLHSCDTHNEGYPVNPHHKIDITLCTEPKPQKGMQVLWSTVVSAIELKGIVTKDYHLVLGQLYSCAEAVFATQPRRNIFIGIVGDGASLEVVRFQRGTMMQVQRTGPCALSLSEDSPGLRLLARVLMASPQDLGFVDPTPVSKFTVSEDGVEWEVQPNKLLQESVKTSLVYSCTCSSPGKATLEAVVKYGTAAPHEARIMQLLWQGYREPLAATPLHIPKPWCFHEEKPCIVTHPYGTSIDFETPAEQLLTVVEDVANTLHIMASLGVLHLDVAPSNIVLHQGHGLLIDFHIARATNAVGEATEVLDEGCGRLAFKSIARLDGKAATLSGELESLMYTLIFWACEGLLAWGKCTEPEVALRMKRDTMTNDFQYVLDKCKNKQLAAVLQRLRDLFFNTHQQSVSASTFIDAIRQA